MLVSSWTGTEEQHKRDIKRKGQATGTTGIHRYKGNETGLQ